VLYYSDEGQAMIHRSKVDMHRSPLTRIWRLPNVSIRCEKKNRYIRKPAFKLSPNMTTLMWDAQNSWNLVIMLLRVYLLPQST
jgi:hypothetical protein